MASTIFCPNCSASVDYSASLCNCGYQMNFLEKKEINDKLIRIDENVIIDYDLEESAISSFNDLIQNYSLDSIYFSSSSAKKDYEKKVKFLQNDLIPKLNIWNESIQIADKIVARDKIEVYGKVIDITDFVLKEFFGPFAIRENRLQVFEEVRDFGEYNFKRTVVESDLDFSDIKTVNFGTIGNDIFNSIGKTLTEGSFKELSQKSDWTDSDVRILKREVGIAVTGQVISGLGKMIGQTQEAINNVRIADSQLNESLEKISNDLNLLSIEEKEILKQKRLYDKNNVILDYCYNLTLKPVVDQLNNDQVYLNYREARKPFDYEQEIISLDKEAQETKIKVSFWSCLLKRNSSIYRSHRNRRLKTNGKLNRYNDLTKALGIRTHRHLENSRQFETQKTLAFQEFEKLNRKTLKALPVIAENRETVYKFSGVLSQIKNNIISE